MTKYVKKNERDNDRTGFEILMAVNISSVTFFVATSFVVLSVVTNNSKERTAFIFVVEFSLDCDVKLLYI
jgi:hypothetical protein